MKKPHILIYTQYFTPESGAAASRMSDYAALLKTAGYQVSVLCEYPSYFYSSYDTYPTHENYDGIDIYRSFVIRNARKSTIQRFLFYLSFYFSSLIKAMTIPHYDVIWVTSPPLTTAFAGMIISRIRNVPYILDIRDLWPESVIELKALKNPLLIAILKKMEKMIYQRARFMTLAVPGFKSKIDPVIYPGQKFCDLMNGVPEEFLRAADPTQEKNGSKFTVLFSGNLGIAQGLDTILDAAAELSGETDIEFVLVGDGVEKDRLKQKAVRMLLNNITFVDALPRSGMPEMIDSADVCLVPLKNIALFKNALPSKMFEYSARKKPLIVSIHGEAAAWVELYESGVVTRPESSSDLAQAIVKLKNNPREMQRLGNNGYRAVSKYFTREAFIEKFDQMIVEEFPGFVQ